MSRYGKKPKEFESTFEIVTAGTHLAICDQFVDIGPQEVEWEGHVKEQEKVKYRFQFPNERITWKDKEGAEHEGPKVLWMTLTNSLHEKAKLRAVLESWRGRAFTDEEIEGFDLASPVGKPCLLNVVHKEYNGRTYANVASISPPLKGMQIPALEGEAFIFDFDTHTDADYDRLPEWLQKLVDAGKALRAEQEKRVEVPIAGYETPPDGDDIPF